MHGGIKDNERQIKITEDHNRTNLALEFEIIIFNFIY